jgi:hypothetical protein
MSPNRSQEFQGRAVVPLAGRSGTPDDRYQAQRDLFRTGDAETEPAAKTSDAVMALD